MTDVVIEKKGHVAIVKFEGNCFGQCFATEDQKYGMSYFLDKNRDKPAKAFGNK